jgi:type IV secretion system protein VirD4
MTDFETDSIFRRGAGDDPERSATARWAAPDVLNKRAEPGGPLSYQSGRIFLGVTADQAKFPVGWQDDRHIVTIAGSRAGKGRSAIIPNLLVYPGSIVCIDPKGENARKTAHFRAAAVEGAGLEQEVFVLDPFDSAGIDRVLLASFNPLADLDPDHDDIIERVGIIADSLVVPTDAKDAHWDESARSLIEAIILHVISSPDHLENRDLLRVRQLLMTGGAPTADQAEDRSDQPIHNRDDFFDYEEQDEGDSERHDDGLLEADDLLEEADPLEADGEPREVSSQEEDGIAALCGAMIENPFFKDAVAGQAMALLAMGMEERGSVLSTARRNTKFLDGRLMHAVLKDGDRPFRFERLKQSPRGTTVYLCLPARYLATHSRWLRLMIALLFEAVERNAKRPECGHGILAIVDEFPILGHLRAMETAAGYIAGFHLQLWAILQDVSQLKRHYPASWETFIGNAGLVQFFGNSDNSTLQFLSARLGETEVIRSLASTTVTKTEIVQDISADDLRARNLSDKSRLQAFELRTDTRSFGTQNSTTTTSSDQLYRIPLITPQELAFHFRRDRMLQGLVTADTRPLVIRRVNYDEQKFQTMLAAWRNERQ